MSGNISLVNYAVSGTKLFHDFNLTEGRNSETGSWTQGYYLLFRKDNNFSHYVKERFLRLTNFKHTRLRKTSEVLGRFYFIDIFNKHYQKCCDNE